MSGRYYTGAPAPSSDFTARRGEHEVGAAREQGRAERENAAAATAWQAKLAADRDA